MTNLGTYYIVNGKTIIDTLENTTLEIAEEYYYNKGYDNYKGNIVLMNYDEYKSLDNYNIVNIPELHKVAILPNMPKSWAEEVYENKIRINGYNRNNYKLMTNAEYDKLVYQKLALSG